MPTHGALSKAGKVRSQTPVVEKTKTYTSPIPRIKNKRRYYKLLYNDQIPRWKRRKRKRRR